MQYVLGATACTTGTLKEGRVRIEGAPRAAEMLESPVHVAPCIGYRVRVSEGVAVRTSRRHDRRAAWVTRHEETRVRPFELVDDGRVRIEVDGDADLDFRREAEVYQNSLVELPARVHAWVSGLGLEVEGKLWSVEEWRLDADEVCTVIGEARRETAPAAEATGYRDPLPTIFVIGKGSGTLTILDRPAKVLVFELRMRQVRALALGLVPFAIGALWVWAVTH